MEQILFDKDIESVNYGGNTRAQGLSNQIFNLYGTYRYRIRLMRVGRRKKVYYKIVVVNWKNRFVEEIGVYNPHLTDLFASKNFVSTNSQNVKFIKIKGRRAIFWLNKQVLLSPFVHRLFLAIDLIPNLK
jgi:ribosomal protein S16